MTQNLPIGAITSPHAVRVRRWPPGLRRPRLHVALAAAGVIAAVAGAAVAASPSPVPVRMSPTAYEIGGSRLTAVAPGTYRGPRGAALVVVHAGGQTRAAASAVLNGAPMTGDCVLPDGASREVCRFSLEGRRLSAEDARTAAGWHRRYDDGRTVDIAVAGGGPVPVPFVIGL